MTTATSNVARGLTLGSLAMVATAVTHQPSRADDSLDLSGEWSFRIDRETEPGDALDPAPSGDTIQLPGSMAERGKGDPVTVESPWTPDTRTESEYYKSDRYAPYREPGNVKVPFALQPQTMYVGAATYGRTFVAPEGWRDKRVELVFERPHWFTHVWVDGEPVGSGDSLSTPHRFALPRGLAPGEHTLAVRVDNRVRVAVGDSAHSVSDHTQTNWNGLVGRLEAHATPKVWVDRVHVTGDTAARRFVVRARIGNLFDAPADATVTVEATPRGGGVPASAAVEARVEPGGGDAQATVDLGPDAKLWDEFSPALYDLRVVVRSADGAEHSRSLVTGLREVSTAGTQITVNGRPIFLRGTLDCCAFPLTGYPPTDPESWKRVFRRCQEFGLNHVRFHSYCPPEAAFVAADELGVYLQPEAASWAYVGDGEPIDGWIYAETRRIIAEYGNHPSFVMMAYGNEPWPQKPTRDKYLAGWAKAFRAEDPRRIYACASGWPTLPESDYHVLPKPRLHQWGEGMKSRLNSQPPTTAPDYSGFVAKHDRPVVAHEIGQWCVYPNLAERPKYTGVTRAKNFDIFAAFLAEGGMERLAQPFLMASGALQEACYKEEVETALRTRGFGGFQLLGLSDFPGQGTAPVGLCDAFWDIKPYASAERFRSFCGPLVPLARLPKRIYAVGEALEATLEAANSLPEDLPAEAWSWRVSSGDKTIAQGDLDADAPTGRVTKLGEIRVPLDGVVAPAEVVLTLSGPRGVSNRWSVWVYPAGAPSDPPASVRVARSLDADAVGALAAGESVVLFAAPKTVDSELEVGFTPIFWNTSYTTNQPPHTLGLLLDPRHPALAGFPTETHSDGRWWEVLHGCRAMELDALPAEVQPIVRVIPDWFAPKRLALAFEAKVAGGKLLVCSADLATQLGDRHAARAFRESLLRYAATDAFAPKVELTPEQVASVFLPAY